MKKAIYVLFSVIFVAGLSVLGAYCGRYLMDSDPYWLYPRLFTIIDAAIAGFCLGIGILICYKWPQMSIVMFVIGALVYFMIIITIDESFVHVLHPLH
jgi:hypothetical protein